MNDSTFPELMVDIGGNYANRMYGYAQPMQADFTRDSITPLDTSKKLSFVINPYDTKVKSLSYEIRTSDGSDHWKRPQNESGIFHADFPGYR